VPPQLVAADPTWPAQARRIRARLNTFCGHRALRIDHIGSTAIAGMDAKDVIDIQVTVESLQVADELTEDLLRAGYPQIASITADRAKADGRSTVTEFDHSSEKLLWRKTFHASADPGRPTNIHLRVAGWPNQQFALLFVDWLTNNSEVRAEYLAVKRAAAQHRALDDYVAGKEPWFLDGYRRAWDWADSVRWVPTPVS
jgi:dephospho-CoA kinase